MAYVAPGNTCVGPQLCTAFEELRSTFLHQCLDDFTRYPPELKVHNDNARVACGGGVANGVHALEEVGRG